MKHLKRTDCLAYAVNAELYVARLSNCVRDLKGHEVVTENKDIEAPWLETMTLPCVCPRRE